MTTAPKRAFLATITLVLLLLAAAMGVSLKKRQEIDQAIKVLRDRSQSTGQQRSAIEELSHSRDPRTTKALIAIALDTRIWPDARVMAVSALAGRNEPDVQDLAELFQPHNALTLREKTAEVLANNCSLACVKEILRYLERIWWGEKPGTLTAKQPMESLKEFVDREQTFQTQLTSILVLRKAETMFELQRAYGLSSVHPSPFAVHLIAELNFTEACPQLSKQFILELADERTKVELDRARAKLKCID